MPSDLIFLETSAYTGDNVEEVFLKCTRSILTKMAASTIRFFFFLEVFDLLLQADKLHLVLLAAPWWAEACLKLQRPLVLAEFSPLFPAVAEVLYKCRMSFCSRMALLGENFPDHPSEAALRLSCMQNPLVAYCIRQKKKKPTSTRPLEWSNDQPQISLQVPSSDLSKQRQKE